MAKKRARIDIITDMLSSIQNKGGEIKPTHLMYKSNLSHGQLVSYLDELLEKELVKKVKKKEYDYIILTDKGFSLLSRLKEMVEFEKTFGL
ncbi:MAG TPA: winged helix-turn-helix domain-containing protein [Candidatus Nanoarchaeia archaeon]|nr:winged helix-turn-helix domain-containing protein [Candidatus Nanoarchaeia archaeon]